MGVLLFQMVAVRLFFKCIRRVGLSCKLLLKTIAPREGFEHLGNFLWNSQVYVFGVSFSSLPNGCSRVRAIHKQYWLHRSTNCQSGGSLLRPLLQTLVSEKPSVFHRMGKKYTNWIPTYGMEASVIVSQFSWCQHHVSFRLTAGKLFYL